MNWRSPVTVPLLRFGTPKPLPPDARAYETFRVTQRFDDIDAYWAERDRAAGREPRKHQATDIGNFRCGDAVVAMAGGIARRVKDNASELGAPSDALGVVIDHGDGVTTEYWHLNRQDVEDGERVASGDRIGLVGSTGLGSVCHLHVEAKRNGVRFDPEPLMFTEDPAVIAELKADLRECREDRANLRNRVQNLTNRQAKLKATIEGLRLELETDDSATVAMLRERLAQIEALAAAE